MASCFGASPFLFWAVVCVTLSATFRASSSSPPPLFVFSSSKLCNPSSTASSSSFLSPPASLQCTHPSVIAACPLASRRVFACSPSALFEPKARGAVQAHGRKEVSFAEVGGWERKEGGRSTTAIEEDKVRER
eukprot:3935181-Rhodomonas_salina.1